MLVRSMAAARTFKRRVEAQVRREPSEARKVLSPVLDRGLSVTLSTAATYLHTYRSLLTERLQMISTSTQIRRECSIKCKSYIAQGQPSSLLALDLTLSYLHRFEPSFDDNVKQDKSIDVYGRSEEEHNDDVAKLANA